jgi:uncharacterized protein
VRNLGARARRNEPCARRVEAGRYSKVPAASCIASESPGAAFVNYLAPILLLVASNVFMTFAWYGHLRYKHVSLPLVIVASWGIAFFEYCLMVPANRMGHAVYSAPQLKAIQEIVTLVVFAGFSAWYLGEQVTPRQLAGFALIVVAAVLIFER